MVPSRFKCQNGLGRSPWMKSWRSAVGSLPKNSSIGRSGLAAAFGPQERRDSKKILRDAMKCRLFLWTGAWQWRTPPNRQRTAMNCFSDSGQSPARSSKRAPTPRQRNRPCRHQQHLQEPVVQGQHLRHADNPNCRMATLLRRPSLLRHRLEERRPSQFPPGRAAAQREQKRTILAAQEQGDELVAKQHRGERPRWRAVTTDRTGNRRARIARLSRRPATPYPCALARKRETPPRPRSTEGGRASRRASHSARARQNNESNAPI